jgi:hypothetical protein
MFSPTEKTNEKCALIFFYKTTNACFFFKFEISKTESYFVSIQHCTKGYELALVKSDMGYLFALPARPMQIFSWAILIFALANSKKPLHIAVIPHRPLAFGAV